MIFADLIERLDEALHEDSPDGKYRALMMKATALRGKASSASEQAQRTRSKAHHVAAGEAHMKAHAAATAAAGHAHDSNKPKQVGQWQGHADSHRQAANDHHTQARTQG